ncbi:MAG: hypothetical protein ABIL58_14755 [Pseudomonadota bacterium]
MVDFATWHLSAILSADERFLETCRYMDTGCKPLSDPSMRQLRSMLVFTVVFFIFTGAACCRAEDSRRIVRVNYVYAAQLGIGGYDVGGLSVQVFTLTLSHTVPIGDGDRWRLKLKAPISLGLYSFRGNDEDGTPIAVDQQTLALLPGLELQIPISDDWTLKPFADLGAGRALESNTSTAVIYTTGITSLYRKRWGAFDVAMGNGLFIAGNGTGANELSTYSAIENGVEVRHPLGWHVGGFMADLGVMAIYYYYPKALEFSRFLQDPLMVRNQLELGFSIGSAGPLTLFGATNPQIGASTIFGDGLTVFRFNFGFPF